MRQHTITGFVIAGFLATSVNAAEPLSGTKSVGTDAVSAVESQRRLPVVNVAAARERVSVFSYPTGLSMSAECLFEKLGHSCARCLPMTPETTYDLAYACYIRRMYSDAIAFADRGLSIREDARLFLIKGVCQMHLDRCAEAEVTAEQYLGAVRSHHLIGLGYAKERVNDPMRVRFDQVVNFLAQGADSGRS